MPVGNLNVEPTTDRSHAADTTNKSVAPEKRDLEVENLAISPVIIDRTLVFFTTDPAKKWRKRNLKPKSRR